MSIFSLYSVIKKTLKKFADFTLFVCAFSKVYKNKNRFKHKFFLFRTFIFLPAGVTQGSTKKIWARSVQPFWRLLDTNKQTNRQTNRQAKFIYRFVSSVKQKLNWRYSGWSTLCKYFLELKFWINYEQSAKKNFK